MMNTDKKSIVRGIIISIFICLFAAANTSADEYEGIKGLDTIKAVFDVRAGNVKSAAMQLDLVHKTFKDTSIREITTAPDFVVVIAGPATKLVTTNTKGFSAEEKVQLEQISGTIAAMAADGIKIEICMFAARAFGVDPATVLPGIKQVENGWISLIGYQAKGYALVALY
ncbi:MAG: DsrE family protein [Desulfobulbaceae bacterium]|nr:DsrE family protein [Desulfobulbaceae bacterium]